MKSVNVELRVAVCDDNTKEIADICQFVCACPGEIHPDCFSSAELLLDTYRNGSRYDLILMDIQMPGLGGIQAATILCDLYYNERPLIVFLTTTDKYVFDGYQVGWNYICKPLQPETLPALFAKAQLELSSRRVCIQLSDSVLHLETRAVLYFEAFYGEVRIVMQDKEYFTQLPLANIQELLGVRPFFLSHRCYLVNLRHIIKHTKTDIQLLGGKTVPLSRNRRAPLIECLSDLHRGIYRG